MEAVFLDWARVLHKEHPVVDAHFDLAAEVYERRLSGERHVVENRYLSHWKEAHLNVLVSSVYVSNQDLPEKGLHKAIGQIAALREDLDSLRGEVQVVTSRKELDQALQSGRTAILFSLEGLDPLGTDLTLLRAFYELGVRGAGLTWSRRNAFAEGCCKASEMREIPGGLTELGREAIEKMEELGMYLDVSHLNNDGFAEVLSCAKKPFIASHSNAWAIHPSYRNLKDDQMVRLAERGGVIGLNACGIIAGVSPRPKEQALNRLCEHVEYLVQRTGEEHVGFGFDLCNGLSDATPRISFGAEEDDCLAHHGEMVELTAALLSRGMSEETVIKVIGGNFLRYFRSVIK